MMTGVKHFLTFIWSAIYTSCIWTFFLFSREAWIVLPIIIFAISTVIMIFIIIGTIAEHWNEK